MYFKSLIPLILFLGLPFFAIGDNPAEPLLKNLPPGIFLRTSQLVPNSQTNAISQKLGGQINRLTNSTLQVHGRNIQINVITTSDEANAKHIYQAIGKNFPFALCQNEVVIEYVGRAIDVPLALKTSYELGLLQKPEHANYQIQAELALVKKAVYMNCNPLFNQFIALNRGNADAKNKIKDLITDFVFGDTLELRDPALNTTMATYQFHPSTEKETQNLPTTTFVFNNYQKRANVPFVQVNMNISVNGNGLYETAEPAGLQSTRATEYWPANNPQIQELAHQIIQGKINPQEKIMALLQWLAPGSHIQYKGQTGSRWGVQQVLKQGFGHCWDFSDVFITLCRAVNVPCRQVAGWFYGSSGHVWAEYYIPEQGWQQVDPTGGGQLQCGLYHIPYFTSETGHMPIVYVSMPVIQLKQ